MFMGFINNCFCNRRKPFCACFNTIVILTYDIPDFYKVRMIKTSFKNSQFQEADFTECDLTGSVFDNCDFSGATFANTIIEKADFRSSVNYSIDPERNRIKKARFSLTASVGLLDKYNIEIDFAN